MQKNLVSVKINKRLDKQMCHMFINSKIGDFDFGKERILDLHPKLKTARLKKRKERNKLIDEYVDRYYENNKLKIKNAKKEIFETWNKVEQQYFFEVEKLFNNKIYLKNKNFVSFLSIFACSPMIEPQGWQIYYKISDLGEIKRLFAHEILHFYYYSYIKNHKTIEKHYKNLSDEDGWTKAELFNVVVLNQEQFQKIINKKDSGYDMHEKYFKTFKEVWRKSKNLDDYLIKIAKLDLETM
jgi:hypothetical protein